MSRHPNRLCATTVAPYESFFFRGRVQWQWFCDCEATESGFATEPAAAIAALAHVRLSEPPVVETDAMLDGGLLVGPFLSEVAPTLTETEVDEVDRYARIRAQQAMAEDGMEFLR